MAIVDRVPLPFLTNPHELALAIVLGFLGVGLLVGPVNPGSVSEQVPHALRDGWAWSLLLGGILTVHGLFADRPRSEWVGQMLTGWGCFFYAVVLLGTVDLTVSAVSGGVFLVLGIAAWWRAFRITATAYVQYRLTEAARAAHQRAAKEGSQ